MQEHEVRKNFEKIVCGVLKLPDLVLRSDLRASDIEGWDSLKHVLLILEIEEFFDVRLPTSEIERVENVGRLSDLVVETVMNARNNGKNTGP